MTIRKTDSNHIEADYSPSYSNPSFTPYFKDITTLEALFDYIPVGIVLGFIPTNLSFTIPQINALLLDFNFVVCDGSEYNNVSSPIFNGAGRYLPNLTNNRFLMGNTTVGSIGGNNYLENHKHTFTLSTDALNYVGNINDTHRHGTVGQTFSISFAGDGKHSHSHTFSYSDELDDPPPYPLYVGFWKADTGSYFTNYYGIYLSGHIIRYGHGTHSHSFYAPTISSSKVYIDHTHALSTAGTIGIGVSTTNTSNLPNFLNNYFIMKVV